MLLTQKTFQTRKKRMKNIDQLEKEIELSHLLKTMDIPEMRRYTLGKLSTLRWLMRNLSIRNAGKPETKQALEIIKELMRGQ